MADTLLRRPAVAGRFYPGDRDELREDAQAYLSQPEFAQQPLVRAIGCIAPHAGYMYSGHVAGAVFARIEIPQRCIVLGPNHTGMGHPLAINIQGAWQTPLGEVPIDEVLAGALQARFPALQEDSAAHRAEHAIEVELPLLQVRQPQLRFVPIAVRTGRVEILELLGHCRGRFRARRRHPDRRLERHEPLRIGRDHSRQGSSGD